LWFGDLTENPVLNRNVAVTIEGGYDFPFQQVVGVTRVHGALRVSYGKVSLGRLAFR